MFVFHKDVLTHCASRECSYDQYVQYCSEDNVVPLLTERQYFEEILSIQRLVDITG